MKALHIVTTIALLLLGSAQVFSADVEEIFSIDTLEASIWNTPAFIKESSGGKYISEYNQSSVNEKYNSRNHLRIIQDGIKVDLNEVTALVAINFLNLPNNGEVFARVAGSFYSTDSYDPTDETGLVFVKVLLGDRGNGLEVWWKLEESLDPDFFNANIQEGVLVEPNDLTFPLQFDTPYLLKLEHDGAKAFTFRVENEDGTLFKQQTADGPDRVAPSGGFTESDIFYAALDTGANFTTPGGSSAAFVRAEFDDAVIRWNTTDSISDAFSTPEIDSSLWEDFESEAFVSDGKLNLGITTESPGSRGVYKNIISLVDASQSCLFAKASYGTGSNIPNLDHRGRIRLEGEWFNDTYPGPLYNGYEGDIFASIHIELRNGALRAATFVFRENADFSGGDDLDFHVFETVPVEGVEYPMYIELDEATKELRMHFNGETHVYQASNIYPVSPGNDYKAISARIQDFSDPQQNAAEGHLEGSFDDVFSGEVCPKEESFCIPIKAKNGNIALICL